MIDEHFQSKDKTMNTPNRIKLVNAMDPMKDPPLGRPTEVYQFPALTGRRRYGQPYDRDRGTGHERADLKMDYLVPKLPGYKRAKIVLLVRDGSACVMDNACRGDGKEMYFLDVHRCRVVKTPVRWYADEAPDATEGAGPVLTIADLPRFDMLVSGCCACDVDGTVYSTKQVVEMVRELVKAGRVTDKTVKVVVMDGNRGRLGKNIGPHMEVLMQARYGLNRSRSVLRFKCGVPDGLDD